MINRTYFIRVTRSNDQGAVVGFSWVVKGNYSLFAQPVAVAIAYLQELQSKFPNEHFEMTEFRQV